MSFNSVILFPTVIVTCLFSINLYLDNISVSPGRGCGTSILFKLISNFVSHSNSHLRALLHVVVHTNAFVPVSNVFFKYSFVLFFVFRAITIILFSISNALSFMGPSSPQIININLVSLDPCAPLKSIHLLSLFSGFDIKNSPFFPIFGLNNHAFVFNDIISFFLKSSICFSKFLACSTSAVFVSEFVLVIISLIIS